MQCASSTARRFTGILFSLSIKSSDESLSGDIYINLLTDILFRESICYNLYYAVKKNKNNQPFILHSGPPYANGKLHIGHFLNFTIKDIIVRFQARQGKYTPFLLG